MQNGIRRMRYFSKLFYVEDTSRLDYNEIELLDSYEFIGLSFISC